MKFYSKFKYFHEKNAFKMLFAKWQPFCSGPDVLKRLSHDTFIEVLLKFGYGWLITSYDFKSQQQIIQSLYSMLIKLFLSGCPRSEEEGIFCQYLSYW